MGQLTMGKSPARMGIRNHVWRAAIPSNRFLAEVIHDTARHIICNINVRYEKKIFLLCRLKINHLSEERNMLLFLAQWSLRLRTGIWISDQKINPCTVHDLFYRVPSFGSG
jgi:hypothetical protein